MTAIYMFSDEQLDAEITRLSAAADLADTDEQADRIDARLEQAYDERDRRADAAEMYPHDEHVGLDVPAGYTS